MKKKLFTLLTLALFFCSGAWAQDFTYALSSFSVTNTTYTYEFSENVLKNKTAWVEVPSSTSAGTITFKASSTKTDRYLYIYKTNGTLKDDTRKVQMTSGWATGIDFTSSDILTSDGKYYLVFSTSDDFKTTGVRYTLTDPSGLEISPASGVYAGKASVTMSANDGYTIYYTDNGTTPTKSSTEYTGTFDVTSNKTIKAIAYKGEDSGFVQTAEYIIVSENRTYDFTALTAADLLALQGNTDNFQDDTSNKYISNKVTWANSTDHAFEGSDGTDISVAQYLLFGRSGGSISATNARYYYGDNKSIYFNNSTCYVKIPAVKAGQKVILEMSGSSNATITGTNTTESSKSYTASSKTKLTFIASANGTVTLTSNKAFFIYSIEVKTPVYYTVEYDLNGGTGTTPTETDKEEGDKFNLHDGTTGITAPSGKVFDGWNDGTSTYAGGEEYTMPGDDVTLTAQWADFVVKHTITYAANGGSGSMANTLVVDGEDQALPASTFTRDCYTFSGWVADVDVTIGGASVSAGTLIDDEETIESVSEDITLTAQWTEAYASGSYDFESSAGPVGSSPSKTITTGEVEYSAFRIDNLFFGASKLAYDNGSSDVKFKGWKIKKSGSTIKFMVENNSAVSVKLGANNGCNIKYTPIGSAETTEALSTTDNTTTTKNVAAGTMVTLTTTSNSTVCLKTITISNVVAISTASGKNYATYVTTNALDFAAVSDEIKAYVAANTASAGSITFTGKDEVPASTPLLIKTASAGATVYVPVIASADAVGTNYLVAGDGGNVTYDASASHFYYILTSGEFKQANNSPVALGKAYLALPSAATSNELTINFDDEAGDVTGIATVSSKKLSNGEYYNLNGQRVDASHKGIVIVNGKKFFNK